MGAQHGDNLVAGATRDVVVARLRRLPAQPYTATTGLPGNMFTPKFWKKNVRTRSFQDCVIKESIRCESVSANLDAMSESAIL